MNVDGSTCDSKILCKKSITFAEKEGAAFGDMFTKASLVLSLMKKVGLVDSPQRGKWTIKDNGRQILEEYHENGLEATLGRLHHIIQDAKDMPSMTHKLRKRRHRNSSKPAVNHKKLTIEINGREITADTETLRKIIGV